MSAERSKIQGAKVLRGWLEGQPRGTHARRRAIALAFTVHFAWTALACGDGSPGAVASRAPDAGAPSLTALTVAVSLPRDRPPVLALVPPFSPTTHDYYVRCAAGTNALTVSITASPGARALLLQPTPSPSAAEQTVDVKVREGDAIVAIATLGTATEAYWVRCLPHDFPTMKMKRHADNGTPVPGYYLVGNTSAPIGGAAYAMALDVFGVPVWYDRAEKSVFNVDAVVKAAISFIDPSTNHSYEVHQLSPLETTYVSVDGAETGEHELRVLSNGDYLVFLPIPRTGVDLTGLKIPLPNGQVDSFGPNNDIIDCTIQEVDPKGNVVWSWVGTDHFNPAKDITYLGLPANAATVRYVIDAFHCNSIDVDTNGNLLVSARHMDSIFYVEKASGKVLWKMGGAKDSKDDATYVPVASPFYRQHDARFLKSWKSACAGRSGSGEISLFDDETAESAPARAVVYDVNVGASGCGGTGGAPAGGATVAREYKGTGPIAATGSFRVLPEGGSIIGWGTNGGFVFTELDAAGHDLLDFYFTDGSSSYRAIKVPLTTFDLNVLRNTTGRDGPVRASDAGVDAGRVDDASAETDGGDDGTDAGVGCYSISGNGSARQCSYSSATAGGLACSSLAGSVAGSCPSSGLYGCCVATTPSDGGGPVTTATCYYSSTVGQPASSSCELQAYEGMPYEWQARVP